MVAGQLFQSAFLTNPLFHNTYFVKTNELTLFSTQHWINRLKLKTTIYKALTSLVKSCQLIEKKKKIRNSKSPSLRRLKMELSNIYVFKIRTGFLWFRFVVVKSTRCFCYRFAARLGVARRVICADGALTLTRWKLNWKLWKLRQFVLKYVGYSTLRDNLWVLKTPELPKKSNGVFIVILCYHNYLTCNLFHNRFL